MAKPKCTNCKQTVTSLSDHYCVEAFWQGYRCPDRKEVSIQTLNLFEILVPTVRNDGRPFHLRFHRIWDKKVREIAGGLSILPAIKGQWVSKEGETFIERNIPVRVACTPEQMVEIAHFTKKYYEQIAIMYYKISSEAYII